MGGGSGTMGATSGPFRPPVPSQSSLSSPEAAAELPRCMNFMESKFLESAGPPLGELLFCIAGVTAEKKAGLPPKHEENRSCQPRHASKPIRLVACVRASLRTHQPKGVAKAHQTELHGHRSN